MMLLKMLCFILLHHGLCPGLVFSPRNVRTYGCPKMIFGTRPHGHHSLFCSSVTSTPIFLPTIVAQRRCLSRRLILGPVGDLKLMFVGSSRAEQLHLCSEHLVVTTVEDSVLRTEMTDLESQEELPSDRHSSPCLSEPRSLRLRRGR